MLCRWKTIISSWRNALETVSVHDAPASLQRMILRLQRCNLVRCKKGTVMLVTYTFRRAHLDETLSSREVRFRKLANRTEKLSLSLFRLVCIKQESLLYSVCPCLLRAILQGSSGNICDCEPSLSPFFQFCRGIVVQGKLDESSVLDNRVRIRQIIRPHVVIRTQISPTIT